MNDKELLEENSNALQSINQILDNMPLITPIEKGGTGCTSIEALKFLLGLNKSENNEIEYSIFGVKDTNMREPLKDSGYIVIGNILIQFGPLFGILKYQTNPGYCYGKVVINSANTHEIKSINTKFEKYNFRNPPIVFVANSYRNTNGTIPFADNEVYVDRVSATCDAIDKVIVHSKTPGTYYPELNFIAIGMLGRDITPKG